MVLGTLYYHWKKVLSVLEHKTILLFACQNMLFIFIKFIHNHQCSYSCTNVYVTVHNKSANINVTFHIKSANINVTVHINKHLKVHSNKQ